MLGREHQSKRRRLEIKSIKANTRSTTIDSHHSDYSETFKQLFSTMTRMPSSRNELIVPLLITIESDKF